MNQAGKRRSGADKAVNAVIALIIIAFLAVGIYASYGTISKNMENKAMENGETEPTVEYLAKQAGMSVDDYLAQYGLAVGDTINASTVQSEMENNMTLENYCNFSGTTLDEMLSGLSDQVSKDTLFKDFMAMPAETVLGADVFAQTKEQYGIGDDVTGDMSWEEFQTVLYEKAYEQQAAAQAQVAATQAPAEGEAAQTPSEETAAE